MDTIAEQMVTASEDLTRPDRPEEMPCDWSELRFLAEHPEFQDTVLEAIQIKVAWALCTGSDAKATRCLELAKEVVAEAPGPEVLRFLRRLSRWYVAGFLPECVILCRGVHENAVKHKFRQHGIPWPATKEGESSMRMTLDAAHRLGWLSGPALRDAKIVWTRGSKAVHEDVEATRDSWGTIRMTLGVLKEIYGEG